MSDARELLMRSDVYGPEDEGDKRLMRDALLAVLDLHREQIGLDDVLRYCYDCEEGWPCATVRAINKTLGVTDE